MWPPVPAWDSGATTRALVEEACQAIAAGEFEGALSLLGKDHGLELVRQWWRAGCLTQTELRDIIAQAWVTAEPDDTQPTWIALWQEAAKGAGTIVDGKALPNRDPLVVFRGQARDAKYGCAWTLDRRTARFFAARSRRPPGAIAIGTVHRRHVLAYLTERDEAEVIVAPRNIRHCGWVDIRLDREPSTKSQVSVDD